MADNTARISELRAILQEGVTTSTVDGTSVTTDLDQVRKELNLLIQTDDTQKARRPRLSSINVGSLNQ